MTDEAPLLQRVAEATAAWDAEAKLWEHWREMPEIYGMSRRRLPLLVELEAPALIIEDEIALTYTRIDQMREFRLKWMH